MWGGSHTTGTARKRHRNKTWLAWAGLAAVLYRWTQSAGGEHGGGSAPGTKQSLLSSLPTP